MTYFAAVQHLINEINADRSFHGSKQLYYNEKLSNDCQLHNTYCAITGKFEHSPYSNGAEIMYEYYGNDNILHILASALHSWRETSSGHCNILRYWTRHQQIGVAAYWTKDRVLVTLRIE